MKFPLPSPGVKSLAHKLLRCKTKSKRTLKACGYPALGNGYCTVHGGSNDDLIPNIPGMPVLKNGLYAVALTKEERDLFDRIELGNVDDEIKIIRLRLRRALILIAKEDKGEAPELRLEETKTEGQGKFKKTTTVKRAPDLETRIEVWTSRIAHLERLRAELLGKLPQTPPAPTPVHVHFD